MQAAGIRKLKGTAIQSDKEHGWMRTWEDVKEGPSQLGQAVLADPATIASFTGDDLNYIMLTRIEPGRPCVTYAGFASTLPYPRRVGSLRHRFRRPPPGPRRDQTRKTVAAALT